MASATGLYLIGDAASRHALSRVGYFIQLNGPLNGHPPSFVYTGELSSFWEITVKPKKFAPVIDFILLYNDTHTMHR